MALMVSSATLGALDPAGDFGEAVGAVEGDDRDGVEGLAVFDVGEFGRHVLVVVALEEAQFPAGCFADGGDDGQAAVDVRAPVFADGEDLVLGQGAERGDLLRLDDVLVNVALHALRVVGAGAAAGPRTGEVFGGTDVLDVVAPVAALGVALRG